MKKPSLPLPIFIFAVCVFGAFLQIEAFGQTQMVGRHQATSNSGIHFLNTPIDSVLKIYAQCTKRTVLHPTLPALSFTLDSNSTNLAEVTAILDQALKEKGIITILDGDKFVRVMPESWKDTAPFRTTPTNSSAILSSITGSNSIAAGSIDFINISMIQALGVYAVIAGAKGFENDINYSNISRVTISLETQTQLTKDEVIYALDTLINWSGFKVVPSTNGLLKLVMLSGHYSDDKLKP